MSNTVDVELSRAVADAMEAEAREGECWANALRAARPAADRAGSVHYVEGQAGGTVGTVPHAWLETEDGRVIEVSPGWLRAAEALAENGREEIRRYLSGRRLTLSEVLDELEAGDGTLPLTNAPE